MFLRQVNASTILDFFNTLSKTSSAAKVGSGANVNGAAGSSSNGLNGSLLDRVAVKEEPLSDEDLRALQKDRQKKDNHNMSEINYNIYSHKEKSVFSLQSSGAGDSTSMTASRNWVRCFQSSRTSESKNRGSFRLH